jgi:hypothetical protein
VNTVLIVIRTFLIAALTFALGFFMGREHLRLEKPVEPKIIFMPELPKLPSRPSHNIEDLDALNPEELLPNIEARQNLHFLGGGWR